MSNEAFTERVKRARSDVAENNTDRAQNEPAMSAVSVGQHSGPSIASGSVKRKQASLLR
jgi:hypothetical protein